MDACRLGLLGLLVLSSCRKHEVAARADDAQTIPEGFEPARMTTGEAAPIGAVSVWLTPHAVHLPDRKTLSLPIAMGTLDDEVRWRCASRADTIVIHVDAHATFQAFARLAGIAADNHLAVFVGGREPNGGRRAMRVEPVWLVGTTPDKHRFVFVGDRGFTVLSSREADDEPCGHDDEAGVSLAKTSDGYPVTGLRECLAKLQNAGPGDAGARGVTFAADGMIEMLTLVGAWDAARPSFPRVLVSIPR